MSLFSETKLRVRYAETDQMGIVYHSNYLIWFEVGRTELFRNLGLPYTVFEEQGLSLAVVEASCRYRQPAKYDDELVVYTRLEKFTSRIIKFSYQVMMEDILLTDGKTSHVFLNKEGRVADVRKYRVWKEVATKIPSLKI
ncbi:acyl-CoA thioesterase [Desulfitobacterium metallireducens]|uniref:Acyl-CoA thioester hydrolase n=1 Tax=Desulfitobacterium metallireducens DSM 15288 TaxID=871968 RepID=W0ECL2_9FIRM|nr:thioesterase family protein [Desulfitobacterium metallireducens]AHF06944.1 acyl-CoA thioester hydrolase [Desulfitobacterium metallireducens DSM 15288]